MIIVDVFLVQGKVDFSAFFNLLLGELLVEALFLDLLLHLSGKGAPRELDGDGAFVDDLKVLVGKQRD